MILYFYKIKYINTCNFRFHAVLLWTVKLKISLKSKTIDAKNIYHIVYTCYQKVILVKKKDQNLYNFEHKFLQLET